VVTGLPEENFNKNPNDAKKMPEKSQTNCLKARKKPNFIRGIAIPLSQKHINYKHIKNFFFEIKVKSCLALYRSSDLP